MKTNVICFVLIVCLSGCEDLDEKFDSEKTGVVNPNQTCQAPSIEQNSIGSWKFGSRQSVIGEIVSESEQITSPVFQKTGAILLGDQNLVIDPDSLFENYIDGFPEPVIYKRYSVETDSVGLYKNLGELFWVRSYAKTRNGEIRFAQANYFKIISNQCNRIHLCNPHGGFEIVLFRY